MYREAIKRRRIMNDIFYNLTEIISLTSQQVKLYQQMRFALKLQQIKNENPDATDVYHVCRIKGAKKKVIEEHFLFSNLEAQNLIHKDYRWRNNHTIKKYKLPETVKDLKLRAKDRPLNECIRNHLKQRLLQNEMEVMQDDLSSIEYILENGCVGYNYYTDVELVEEYERWCCEDPDSDEELLEAKAQLAIQDMLEEEC